MVVVGLACVFVAFIGNVMDNAEVVPYFVCYYAVMLALCFAMFQRVRVLKVRVWVWVWVCVCGGGGDLV